MDPISCFLVYSAVVVFGFAILSAIVVAAMVGNWTVVMALILLPTNYASLSLGYYFALGHKYPPPELLL